MQIVRTPVLGDLLICYAPTRASRIEMWHYSDGNPREPDDSGDDPICYLALGRVPAELETQAAVDDTERDHGPTPPDMGDTPDGTLQGLPVDLVVEKC